MRVLVTGHLGFIGSHFVKYLLKVDPNIQIVGFGRCSDQKNLQRLSEPYYQRATRVQEIYGDLTDHGSVSGLCEGIDVVVNLAAKTFVDHSLKDDQPFVQSNILGARNLMQDAMRYGVKRFVQVSTDEVYGQILVGSYKEDALLNPRNPYSWSKACADLYAIQLHRTYGFPVIITRTENNFGPWQHRQKAIPTFVREALSDRPIPVYGDGMHVRCWLHVNEHCKAIWHLIQYSLAKRCTCNFCDNEMSIHKCDVCGGTAWSTLGEVFHIAGEEELTNLALAKLVLKTLNKSEDAIKFIEDRNIRPGHDRRYALNCDKLRATGFSIEQSLLASLKATVLWYAENPEWTR